MATFTYLIALGSNLGDRSSYLLQAMADIAVKVGPISRKSEFLRNDPVGNADQEFMNAAVLSESEANPQAVMQILLDIELSLGRERLVHWGNRTIDLDMILARTRDGVTINCQFENLVLPHPRAHEREFVIIPCAEIAPDWMLAGKTISTWANEIAFKNEKR